MKLITTQAWGLLTNGEASHIGKSHTKESLRRSLQGDFLAGNFLAKQQVLKTFLPAIAKQLRRFSMDPNDLLAFTLFLKQYPVN